MKTVLACFTIMYSNGSGYYQGHGVYTVPALTPTHIKELGELIYQVRVRDAETPLYGPSAIFTSITVLEDESDAKS